MGKKKDKKQKRDKKNKEKKDKHDKKHHDKKSTPCNCPGANSDGFGFIQ